MSEATLVIRCERHPIYSAISKPRAECIPCRRLYEMVNLPRTQMVRTHAGRLT